MKKGYFKGLNQSFGIIPVLLLAAAFFGVFYLAGGNLFASEATLVKNIVSNVGYALFIGLALVGFVGLRDEEIDFIDILRPAGIIGGAGSAVFAIVSDNNMVGLVIYSASAVIMLIQLIVRVAQKEFSVGTSGFKSYFSAVASKLSPIFVLLIGAVVATVVYIYRAQIVTTQIDEYIVTYASAVGFGLLVMSLLFALAGQKKANFLDVLLEIIFVGSLLSLVYTIFTLEVFKPVLILCVLSLASLLIRGAAFRTDKQNLKGIKINRYYADLFSKFDLIAIFVLSIAAVALYIIPSFKGLNLLTQSVNALDITFSDNMQMILGFVGAGIIALMLILCVVFRNIKNPEIKPIDFAVAVLLHAGLFALPIVGWIIVETSTFNIASLSATRFAVIAAFGIALFLGCILTIIRVKNYQGIEAQVEAFEKIREEEALAQTEEAQTEEAQAEETQAEETQAEEASAEEVEEVQPEEEVVYVDENGNEVEAPAEGEEVEEQIVYVDENGNEVEAPAEGDEVTEEVVYVDEDGNEIEAPAEGEEVVYVDENGNEITEEAPAEEVVEEAQTEEAEDDEAEDEEDDEDDEAEEMSEDDEFEAAIAAINDAPANHQSIVVEDIRPVDEEGNVKKIKRKFNARMMYASEEAKNYYNEIKNYLVMYRAKGRNSSRCETFRYKGLVAKVALAGKSIKVCLAIDPSSLVDTKYHFKDVSSKKQYVDVPTMIKVRSDRGLKHFKELVDMMMGARGVKVKRNFEPTDYTKNLIPNGEAILGTLGYSVDYLYNTMNVDSIPEELPDDLEQYLPKIMGDALEEERVEAPIYLDTLCNHFVDGDEITIDVLKTLHVVTKGNVLKIKARGTLDRKLTIYADEFEPEAVKMLLCTNCTAVKIIRPEEDAE